MRRIIVVLFSTLVWSLPAFAIPPKIPNPPHFPLPSVCCQFGSTYGTTGSPPTCFDIDPLGVLAKECADGGGTVTSGSCAKDGACGGSTVCCEGVSIGEGCTLSGFAQPDSCAATTEAACDALSPAGEQATKSVPFTTCVSSGSGKGCQGPVP
jgi:hypothetical protein